MEKRDPLSMNSDEYFDYLVETGSIYPQTDDSGETLYYLDPERAAEYAPEYMAEVYKESEDFLIDMLEQGLLDVEFKEDENGVLEAFYSATELGRETLKNQ